MKKQFHFFVKLVAIIIFSTTPTAFAADTSIAGFNISANVPQFFSATTRGVPGDIDLSPNVVVNNRRIGLVHLKYNINVASLTISSNTASGAPQAGGVAYSFQGGFKVAIAAGCASVDPTYNTPFVLTAAGTDVKSALSAALVTGIEEDCDITASWVGTSSKLPLAGIYSMTVNVTMTSN
jgi:hypothetical protein